MSVDAKGEPGTSRTVWYNSGVEIGVRRVGQRLTVEGIMWTRIIPAPLIDGQQFAAVCEVRIRGRRPVRP